MIANWKKTIYQIISGLVLLSILFFFIDIESFINVLHNTNPLLLVLSILFLFPIYILKSLRLKNILLTDNLTFRLIDMVIIFFSSNFLGFITPGRIGEFAKAFYFKDEKGISIARTLPAIILDRIFDLVFLAIVALIGFIYFNILGEFSAFHILIIICFFIGCFLLINKHVIFWILNLTPIQNSIKLKEYLVYYYEGLRNFGNVKLLITSFILTSIAYGFLFLQCEIIANSLGIGIGIFEISLMMAVTNILSFLPISFSGIGTRELTLVFLFLRIGIASEVALAYSLLVFSVFNVIGGFIGFLCWIYKPIEIFKQSKKRA